jgi:hypothetical protein
VAWDIEATDEFQAWWSELSDPEHEAITIGTTVSKKRDRRSEGRELIRWQKIQRIRT